VIKTHPVWPYLALVHAQSVDSYVAKAYREKAAFQAGLNMIANLSYPVAMSD